MILIYFHGSDETEKNEVILSHVFALAKRDFPFRILLSNDHGEIAAVLRERSISFDVIRSPIPQCSMRKGLFGFFQNLYFKFQYLVEWFYYMKKISRFYGMYPFAIVHCADMSANLLSIFLKVRFNAVLIWTLREIFRNKIRQFFFQRLASVFCDHLISSSRYLAQQVDRTNRWREHLSVLHAGIEIGVENSVAPILTNQKFVLAMAVRDLATDYSSCQVFLRTIELCRRTNSNVRGVVFVFGKSENTAPTHWTDAISTMNLSDVIEICFLEYKYEPGRFAQAYARYSVNCFMHPGVSFEMLDLPLTDAVLAGIPVVCGRDGAFSEYFMHGHTALFAESGNAQAFVAVLNDIIQNQSNTRARAELARKEFLIRFATTAMETHFDSVYKKYVDAVDSENENEKRVA